VDFLRKNFYCAAAVTNTDHNCPRYKPRGYKRFDFQHVFFGVDLRLQEIKRACINCAIGVKIFAAVDFQVFFVFDQLVGTQFFMADIQSSAFKPGMHDPVSVQPGILPGFVKRHCR
jgi:hypothetical protein